MGRKPRATNFNPDTLNAQGVSFCQRKQLTEGTACFRRVLSSCPTHRGALLNYAIALSDSGRPDEAIAAYRRGLAAVPDHPEMLTNLGLLLLHEGKPTEAITHLKKATDLNPTSARELNNLGLAYFEQERLPEAEACYRRALTMAPDFPPTLINLALVCFRDGRLDESEELLRRALALRPNSAEAACNLGMILRLQNELPEAEANCLRALDLMPGYPQALVNLANVLDDTGHYHEATALLKDAMSRSDDWPEAHKVLGFFLLAAGYLKEGWFHYEWRLRQPERRREMSRYTQPRWIGAAHGEGQTLLLWAEQGHGDTIQFCRYAPLAAERGFRVVLRVPSSLVRLVGSLPEVRINAEGTPLPPHDLQCPLLSLPMVFGTDIADIPAGIPYLAPDRQDVSVWRGRLGEVPSSLLKIGLCWAGNPRRGTPTVAIDRRRSINPSLLAPLLNIPGVRFYSLQKDGPPAPAAFGLIDLMDECRDFADTAALIANLDLVVSVDTSIVHLAGALGKPVWVLNRFDSCWRWLRDRDDSPWYPTLRLFRQPSFGDWDSVVTRVRDELGRYAARERDSP